MYISYGWYFLKISIIVNDLLISINPLTTIT